MELISTHYVMAKQVGYHGNLFGGIMLAWLDEAGAAYACQKGDSTQMVTRFMSQVEFKRPVKVGRIVKIYGRVLNVGNTSIKIFLEAKNLQ